MFCSLFSCRQVRSELLLFRVCYTWASQWTNLLAVHEYLHRGSWRLSRKPWRIGILQLLHLSHFGPVPPELIQHLLLPPMAKCWADGGLYYFQREYHVLSERLELTLRIITGCYGLCLYVPFPYPVAPLEHFLPLPNSNFADHSYRFVCLESRI